MAIIINTSFHVEEPLVPQFIAWLKDTYAPAVRRSGICSGISAVEILMETAEGMKGYAVQLSCPNQAKAFEWMETDGAELILTLHRKYGQRILFFTTPMSPINL